MAQPADLQGDVSAALDAAAALDASASKLQSDTAQARRVEGVSLRLAGFTYEQVGERLGISAEGARQLVSRTLTNAENRNVDEMRDLENARLDRAQAAIWTKVISGDLKAVDTFLKISIQRSKINGLNAATKVDLNVGIRNEMEMALAEFEMLVQQSVGSTAKTLVLDAVRDDQ